MIKFGDATAPSVKDVPAPKKAAAPAVETPTNDLLDGDLTGAGDKPKPAKKRFGAKAAKPAKTAG